VSVTPHFCKPGTHTSGGRGLVHWFYRGVVRGSSGLCQGINHSLVDGPGVV
jgi:hypothetical protein